MSVDLNDPFYIQKVNRQMVSTTCNARFGGGGTEEADKFTKPEKRFRADFVRYLQGNIEEKATPYDGETFAELDPQVFENMFSQQGGFNELQGQGNQAMSQQLSGEAAFQYDPQQTTDFWQSNVANPLMNTWQNTVGAELKEGFGGGDLFNTRATQQVGRQAGEFFGQRVAPTLFNAQMQGQQMGFQSGENAAARQGQAVNMLNPYIQSSYQAQAQPALFQQGQQQAQLSDQFAQFNRMTDEESPWLKMILSAYTGAAPSVDTVVNSGGGVGGAVQGAAGGAMAGATVGGPYGAVIGGVVGGVAGAFG